MTRAAVIRTLWTGHELANGSPGGRRRWGRISPLDRQVVALAAPAFGALVVEPVFILVDSVVVGTLGTTPLAGLALASTVLTTVVGMCVFLAYATTAGVARLIGAGRRRDALRQGVHGLWLALLIGVVLAVGLLLVAAPLARVLGASADVLGPTVAYLRWSAPGVPGMLLVMAAQGVLRGLLDTRTPLVVAVAGAVLNGVLSVTFVLGLGWGVAGAGGATALTQLLMAGALGAVVVRGARAAGVSMRPGLSGVGAALVAGLPLLARTLSLRAAILLATWVATGLGAVTLAGHQAVGAIWQLSAFALDALAIAAQALVGQRLGAADVPGTRAVLRRTLTWGVGGGAALGAVVAAVAWPVARLFTDEPDVHRAVALALLVAAASMPVAGWVFVLDGVLIGAGDGRYLAWAGVATLAAYLPAALAVRAWAPEGPAGLAWAWAAFAGVFMLARAVTTGWRARGTAWMRTGA